MMQNNLIAQNFTAIESTAGVNSPKDVGSLVGLFLPYVYSIVTILLLIYLVMGGLQMMTSRGDPKAMQGAQAKITNALIGFFIVFISFILVKLIGQIFHISAFAIIFGV